MTFKRPSVWSNLSFFISGLGWAVHWWPVERCPSTADLLPPVQEVPPLLPTKPWPLQGQEARLDGAGSQADLEAGKRASVQLQGAGEAIKNNTLFQTRGITHQHFCFNGKFLKQDLRRLYLAGQELSKIKSSESLWRPVLSVQCWKFEWSWKGIR